MSDDMKPVAWQWRAVEDGEPRTGWAFPEEGDRLGWQELARRHAEKYTVERRSLYSAATFERLTRLNDAATARLSEYANDIERLTREAADLRVNLASSDDIIAELRRDRDRWKNNHDDVVRKKRAGSQIKDARAEAAEAALAKAQHEFANYRAARVGDNAELRTELAKARENAMLEAAEIADDHAKAWGLAMGEQAKVIAEAIRRAALAPAKTATPTLDASAGHTAGDPTGHASLARLSVTIVDAPAKTEGE